MKARSNARNRKSCGSSRTYAEKVEKYNELLQQKRFDEAIVLAKEARVLQPENPVSELMVLKAKFARQDDFNKNLKERKDDQFTQQLNDVDESATGYVSDIDYPTLKKWKELTDRRKKYKRADSRTPSPEELKIERSLSRRGVAALRQRPPVGSHQAAGESGGREHRARPVGTGRGRGDDQHQRVDQCRRHPAEERA